MLVVTSTNQMTRLTGVTLNGGETSDGVWVGNVGGAGNSAGVGDTSGITKYGLFRIDHCWITHCTDHGVLLSDIMNGVVDHCTFVDNYLHIGHYPSGYHPISSAPYYLIQQDYSWQLALTIGSTNCSVVEDCVFLHT